MNKTEYLLTKVIEECSELIKACTKAQRFGLDDKNPKSGKLNSEEIHEEFLDLLAAIHMCQQKNIINKGMILPGDMSSRIAKIKRFMQYSRKQGTLRD